MSALPQIQPITARVTQRPAFEFAPSFDAWIERNRRAVANYAFEVVMASVDEDLEPIGLRQFARQQYDTERAMRGLPLHVAAEHCEHGNRIGDFCTGCEQQRMG